MENLLTNYAVCSIGDTIGFEYRGQTYYLNVIDANPSSGILGNKPSFWLTFMTLSLLFLKTAVSLSDVVVKLDFLPPVDYDEKHDKSEMKGKNELVDSNDNQNPDLRISQDLLKKRFDTIVLALVENNHIFNICWSGEYQRCRICSRAIPVLSLQLHELRCKGFECQKCHKMIFVREEVHEDEVHKMVTCKKCGLQLEKQFYVTHKPKCPKRMGIQKKKIDILKSKKH